MQPHQYNDSQNTKEDISTQSTLNVQLEVTNTETKRPKNTLSTVAVTLMLLIVGPYVIGLAFLGIFLLFLIITGYIKFGPGGEGAGFILAIFLVGTILFALGLLAIIGSIRHLRRKNIGGSSGWRGKISMAILICFFTALIYSSVANFISTPIGMIAYRVRGGPSQFQLDQIKMTNGTIDDLKKLLDSCHVSSMTVTVFNGYGPPEPKNLYLDIKTVPNGIDDQDPPVKNLTLPFSDKTNAEKLILEKNKKRDGSYENCSSEIRIESQAN